MPFQALGRRHQSHTTQDTSVESTRILAQPPGTWRGRQTLPTCRQDTRPGALFLSLMVFLKQTVAAGSPPVSIHRPVSSQEGRLTSSCGKGEGLQGTQTRAVRPTHALPCGCGESKAT